VKKLTYLDVTAKRLTRAYLTALKRAVTNQLAAAAVSAGFTMPLRRFVRGPLAGWQVFVKVVRFDEAKLAKHPLSGGLPRGQP
jgi:uncharacterized protein YhjY with autotransporter beta-barrel domain